MATYGINKKLKITLICYLMIVYFAKTAVSLLDEDNSIACQSTNDSRALSVPPFPKEFEAHMEVTDLFHNYTTEVEEYVRNSRSVLRRISEGKTTTCLYDDRSKKGHIINGVHCVRGNDLPHQCFCKKTCLPFIPLKDVFSYMEKYNAVMTSYHLSVRGIPVDQWSVRCWNTENRNITLAIDLYLSRRNYPMAAGDRGQVPVRVSIYSQGDLLKILDPNVQHLRMVLEITQFRTSNGQATNLMPPPGIFCPEQLISKKRPKLADQFSVTMETVINDKSSIIYVNHHYDSIEKLVAYELRPHHHMSISLSRLYDIAKPIRYYRIIHDFQSGIQYVIDERSGNCSITSIPLDSIDAVATDEEHVRLRHANELINTNHSDFVYQGQRTIRGIPCDVWVATKTNTDPNDTTYSTIEVYFTLDSWTVEVEVLNRERQVPLGIAFYTAESAHAEKFSSVQRTFYYGYSHGHPNWGNFDISTCLTKIDRLYLLLVLKVPFLDLARNNLDTIEDSIRRGIAGFAGISPLRITNMFIGKSLDDEVDVWFVLLERPDVIGNVQNPRVEICLNDAYRMLREIIDHHDATIDVELGVRKTMQKVSVRRGSLETTRESLHPNTRHKGLRYLRAGYTAGSMAGLGFSMAILGTCIGVFVGFLLWKRGTGIPYHVHH
ncbi:hypothetical protein CHUAL_004988 [Chamberlinius hualienensis]